MVGVMLGFDFGFGEAMENKETVGFVGGGPWEGDACVRLRGFAGGARGCEVPTVGDRLTRGLVGSWASRESTRRGCAADSPRMHACALVAASRVCVMAVCVSAGAHCVVWVAVAATDN